MAHVPTSTVDFAPSWLNFNTTSQKPDKLTERRTAQNKIFSEYRAEPSYKPGPSLVCHHSFEAKSQLHSGDSGHKEGKGQWFSSTKTTSPLLLSNTAFKNNKSVTARHISNTNSKRLENVIRDCEFPSLSETKEKTQTFPDLQNNMWRKPLVVKPIDSESNCSVSSKNNNKQMQTSSIYKSLVPKANITSNKPYRRAVSVPLGGYYNNNSESDNSAQFKTNTALQSTLNLRQRNEKSSNHLQATTTTSLNGMTVFSKKTKRGKNSYLKDLRNNVVNDNGDHTTTVLHDLAIESIEDPDWTGKNDSEINDGNPLNYPSLSSSLEAEHRFLREMGWTEGSSSGNGGDSEDEDVSPLTDAEIREFFMRNKKRGLLAVPSISKRTSAFREALDAWSNSGPPIVRKDPSNGVLREEEEEEEEESYFKSCS